MMTMSVYSVNTHQTTLLKFIIMYYTCKAGRKYRCRAIYIAMQKNGVYCYIAMQKMTFFILCKSDIYSLSFGYVQFPESADVSYNMENRPMVLMFLYDLGRHLFPPISLTVLTLTLKKYL